MKNREYLFKKPFDLSIILIPNIEVSKLKELKVSAAAFTSDTPASERKKVL